MRDGAPPASRYVWHGTAGEKAAEYPAVTIAITASGSPLASTCQIHLAADHPEGYDRYSPMVSRLMHLLIIDVLATCLHESVAELLDRAEQSVRTLRVVGGTARQPSSGAEGPAPTTAAKRSPARRRREAT